MTLRLRFWLAALSAARLLFGFGSPAYYWCVSRAGACADYTGCEGVKGGEGEPF